MAEERTGQAAHLLEKDVWVVQTMAILFGAPFGANLVLKGGTSLSTMPGALHIWNSARRAAA